jgi:hypothetical protein
MDYEQAEGVNMYAVPRAGFDWVILKLPLVTC